jgi:hypothetical protein
MLVLSAVKDICGPPDGCVPGGLKNGKPVPPPQVQLTAIRERTVSKIASKSRLLIFKPPDSYSSHD